MADKARAAGEKTGGLTRSNRDAQPLVEATAADARVGAYCYLVVNARLKNFTRTSSRPWAHALGS